MRIPIPKLLDEAWDSVIIATYGADLDFYERLLLPQLRKARNRVIFCDGRQITQQLAEPDSRSQLRQLNHTYVLAPIWASRAAHAKLLMLLSPERGLLAVGSGNLGMRGYASQGECFTRYCWSESYQDQLGEFVAARSFIDQMCDQRLVDPVVRKFVRQAWQEAPWVYGRAPSSSPRVRHNLERTLVDQFVEAVNERTVDELIVHAPFYDRDCQALAELIHRTSPKTLTIILQERLTSVDPERLKLVLARTPGPVEVRSVSAADKGTFLHAKFLIARCASVAVCLQGSPNISSRALLHAHPEGNIELANLLTGDRYAFDHLIGGLVVSPDPVDDISQLGLSIKSEGTDGGDPSLRPATAELYWVAPELKGLFDRELRVPPALFVDGSPVHEAEWEISEPSAGMTRFSVTLGADAAAALNRVTSVCFAFETGEESSPMFPYHLNSLTALASGQARTDLLRHAGDFDLGDEELLELLEQLEEALAVDGHSVWRTVKRTPPNLSDNGTSPSIAYDDLDWDAIQSHPKLAQYRNWGRHSAENPTPLGILLTSIASRFEATVRRGRAGEPKPDSPSLPDDPPDDLAKEIDAEDEEAAEKEELARNRRRAATRSKAKRQYQGFVKRFVTGLTDEAFVRHAGPSVIVPSYVIFNHLCWKLIQIDLADPPRLIKAQIAIWRFFWGDKNDSGYFETLSTADQEAVLDILDRHHSEAVLLCSIFQASNHAQNRKDQKALTEVRDAWRTILLHQLFQPTSTAVGDSTTQLQRECKSASHLIKRLDHLAAHVAENEPRAAVARALVCRPDQVVMKYAKVNRRLLGPRVVDIYAIENLDTAMTPESASHTFSALTALDPDTDYIRVKDESHNVVAFADYHSGDFVYANRSATDNILDLDRPTVESPPWRAPLETLHEMARIEIATA